MIVRDLSGEDFRKGYLDLLKQLTIVGDVTSEAYEGRFQEISCNPDYIVKVVEDEVKGLVVATGTLFVERKFIRSCAKAGHVEDVVVSDAYRGQRLGQRVIEELLKAAEAAGCYKVILDCAEANVDFYAKCGLVRKEVQMVKYFQT